MCEPGHINDFFDVEIFFSYQMGGGSLGLFSEISGLWRISWFVEGREDLPRQSIFCTKLSFLAPEASKRD